MVQHVDVLIAGAGISGIGMACHLQQTCPGKRYAILERRLAVGGTWDLFRYPGVRSDSDMFSFAYAFRPWTSPTVLARGPLVRDYVRQTAQEFGVDRHIRFGLKIVQADWSSAQQRWTIEALQEDSGAMHQFTCNFFVSCTGYYDYDQAYQPRFEGLEQFQGQCVHPQFWPEQLDYHGKQVVVIGSGATAVTLVPAMAPDAAHVTMLQRSPTYYVSAPNIEKLVAVLHKVLPARWIYAGLRRTYIALQRAIFKSARRWPRAVRTYLLRPVKKALGSSVDMRHFTPHYMPWDQRVCVVPDGDLFRALKSGKASVVTDQIARFTANGLVLKSGQTLAADIVVMATGLQLKTFGGIAIRVDGRPMQASQLLSYRAVLMQDVPNMGFLLGYTNASWTLKVDIAARYLCRLLQHLDAHALASATPRAPHEERTAGNVMDSLSAGYVQRGSQELPRQGRSTPWRVTHAYEEDQALLNAAIDDGLLEFAPLTKVPPCNAPA